MADISRIKVGSTTYDIKDTTARTRLSALEHLVESGVQIVIADTLPTAAAATMGKIYFIPHTHEGANDVYDEYLNGYICPNNQVLKYSTTNKDGYREFKSDGNKCANCPFLSKCTNSKNHVKVITEHVWNNYLIEAEETRYKIGSKEIYKQRKETIERCFGDGKENFGLRFTRYTGLKKVTQGLLLLFACMNFKKMARWKAKMA